MIKQTAICAVLVAGLAACTAGAGTPQPAHPIRLLMTFMPNVQYAPLYVANEQGYFRQENLDVTFDYIQETECVSLVGVGDQPFAVVSGEQVLMAREQGLPVVYAMAWWNNYPVAVAALEESGIQTPQDLKGKTIGLPMLSGASYIGFSALLESAGIREDEVMLEVVGYNQMDALVTRKVDAVVIYANNEPVQLAADGYTVNVIRVADHVDLASNGLLTNERTLKENPEMVRGMIRAILHGVQDSIADPDKAFQLSRKYVEISAEKEPIQRQVLSATLEFWKSETPGASDLAAWRNMETTLRSMGLLTGPLDVGAAFTNEYLPK
jgi:NitT/TauT family transport system substrate-binding protein